LEILLVIRDAVGENDADMLVQVEASLGRGADIQMNQIPKRRFRFRINDRSGGIGRGEVRGEGDFDDGTGGVAALADEGFGACFHAGEVVGDEEEFHGRFVGVLDHDLKLALLGNAVAAAEGGFGGGGASFSLITFAEGEVHGYAVVFVATF